MVTPKSTVRALKSGHDPVTPPPRSRRPGDGMGSRLQSWWQSIWRRRWLSMVVAWLICMAGWTGIALWPTEFSASAVVYADLAKLAGAEAASEKAERTPTSLFKDLLLSDDNLDGARDAVALDPIRSRTLRDDVMLRSTVPSVFVVAYEHRDPEVARKVLERLVGGFKAQLGDGSSSATEDLAALDREIADHEQRLEAAQAGVEGFEIELAEVLQGDEALTDQLDRLESEATALEQRVERATAERDRLAETLAGSAEAADDSEAPEPAPAFGDVEQERATLEDELVRLRERYADSHPYVVEKLAAIETLDEQIDAAAAPEVAEQLTLPDGTLADRDALEQRHGELIADVSTLSSRLRTKQREIDRLQALTATAGSVEAELSELTATRDNLDVALEDLRQRRETLGDVEGDGAKQDAFRLIKQPERPNDPIGPSRLVALTAVLIGGFGFGMVAAVSCNRYKGVFENAWQLKQRFDVGVLGTISEVMTPLERRRLGYARLAFGVACVALVGLFGSLVVAELNDLLAPLGDHLRSRILG